MATAIEEIWTGLLSCVLGSFGVEKRQTIKRKSLCSCPNATVYDLESTSPSIYKGNVLYGNESSKVLTKYPVSSDGSVWMKYSNTLSLPVI